MIRRIPARSSRWFDRTEGDAPSPRPNRSLTASVGRLLLFAALVAGWMFSAWIVLMMEHGTDAYAYWAVDLANPYRGVLGDHGFFPYSPPAAAVASLFSLLPWPVFLISWQALLLGALAWLSGRWFVVVLAFPAVAVELALGNITLLIALVVVLGFRWPALWAFALLTKVTPGIGLLWFLVRREWRNLALALGATAAIAVVSMLFLPGQWAAWLSFLLGDEHIGVPLWYRLPIAAMIVIWGARTNRPWTVAAAVAVSLPRLGLGDLSMLVAVFALMRRYGDAASPPTGPFKNREPVQATAQGERTPSAILDTRLFVRRLTAIARRRRPSLALKQCSRDSPGRAFHGTTCL